MKTYENSKSAESPLWEDCAVAADNQERYNIISPEHTVLPMENHTAILHCLHCEQRFVNYKDVALMVQALDALEEELKWYIQQFGIRPVSEYVAGQWKGEPADNVK